MLELFERRQDLINQDLIVSASSLRFSMWLRVGVTCPPEVGDGADLHDLSHISDLYPIY